MIAALIFAAAVQLYCGPQCQKDNGVTNLTTTPVPATPLRNTIIALGIQGFTCTNSSDKPGFVRWYDGDKEVYVIAVPGRAGQMPPLPLIADSVADPDRNGVTSDFHIPIRIGNPSFKADNGIKCNLSFPMDAP